MRSSSTIVTILVIAAVLVAAYAVGLMIRQARVGDGGAKNLSPVEVAEANEALIQQETAKLSHGPGAGRTQDTPEERAELKEKRAQALEKMESATDEQKAQFREQVREGFNAPRGKKRPRGLSPKQAQAVQGRTVSAGVAPVPDPNTKLNSEKTGVEPNAAGQS